MRKFFKHAIVLIFAFLLSMSAFALDSHYKNNLLDIEFNQSANENVNISLYFEKPYSAPIKTNFKGNNQYSILLPETYHSITSAHFANAANVKSVDVKLVPAFDQSESSGYTKILITATKPTIFIARTHVSAANSTSDAKLAKLLNEPKPAQTATKTTQAKTASAKTVQKTATAKTAQKATPTKPAVVAPVASKTGSKPTSAKPAVATAKTTKPIETTKIAKAPVIAKITQKIQEKTIKTTAPAKNQAPPAITEKPKSEAPPKTVSQEQSKTMPNEITQDKKAENTIQTTKNEKKLPVLFNKTIAKITATIALPLILLIWLLKLFNKNDRRKTNLYNDTTEKIEESRNMNQENENNEKYASVQVEGTIDGSLSWQEKYRLLKETEEQAKIKEQEEKKAEISDELDNIYGGISPTIKALDEQNPQTEAPSEEPEISEGTIEDGYLDESLNLDDLDNLDNLDNFDEPEIVERKWFEQPQETSIETTEETSFNDILQNTQETVKEDTTETFEVEDLEELEEESITEQFEDTTDFDEFLQEQEPENISEEETEELEETDYESQQSAAEEQEETFEEESFATTPEDVLEVPEEQYGPQSVATSPISNEPVLINEAKISKTKGFYLIKYATETALVGYIKDKIFVLNTFEDSDQTFVQTRLNEKKQGREIYIVRSNNYKALVEVGKEEMKTVIEL